jgi:hypothetical protein
LLAFSDPFLLVQSHHPGVFPDHALVKHSAGENVEVLFFQSNQVTIADLGNPGDGVQRDPAELPLLSQCLAEITHTSHPYGYAMAPPNKGRGSGERYYDAWTCADIVNHKAALVPGQKQIPIVL